MFYVFGYFYTYEKVLNSPKIFYLPTIRAFHKITHDTLIKSKTVEENFSHINPTLNNKEYI